MLVFSLQFPPLRCTDQPCHLFSKPTSVFLLFSLDRTAGFGIGVEFSESSVSGFQPRELWWDLLLVVFPV